MLSYLERINGAREFIDARHFDGPLSNLNGRFDQKQFRVKPKTFQMVSFNDVLFQIASKNAHFYRSFVPFFTQSSLKRSKKTSKYHQRRRRFPSLACKAASAPFTFDSLRRNHVIESSSPIWRSEEIPMGPEGYLYLQPGARLGYFPQFIQNAEDMYKAVESESKWEKRAVIIQGKEYMQPRMICYMADSPNLTYTYFKTTNFPIPYAPSVLEVKDRLERAFEVHLNSVLMNFYQTGNDLMEFHGDDEPCFGEDPTIFIVSLGQRRALDIRKTIDPLIRFRYLTGEGDVLIMEGGALQRDWEHGIVEQGEIKRGRISMTFRSITNPEPVENLL